MAFEKKTTATDVAETKKVETVDTKTSVADEKPADEVKTDTDKPAAEKPVVEKPAKPVKAAVVSKESAAEKPAPEKKKSKRIVDEDEDVFVIDPSRRYEFATTTPSSYFTIPRHIKVWDEDTDSIRVIRYSSIEKSPYLDEQRETVPDEGDIAFNKGKLFVHGTNAALITFLLKHDWIEGKKVINPDNLRGAASFKFINRDTGVSADLKRKKLVSKAIAVVGDSDFEDVKNFMLSVFGFDGTGVEGVTKTDDAIELEAYRRAETNPDLFVDKFNSDEHAYKAVVLTALKKGILSDLEDGLITRTDTGTVVYKFDTDKFSSADSAAAAWILETTDGKKFYSQLKEMLEA